MTYCGSIFTLPPPPVPSRTEALIVLLMSWTVPLGLVVILIAPPLAWVASVVTELFVIANWLPALIWMLPVLPGPVLLAETLEPLVIATESAFTKIFPPAPRFVLVVNKPVWLPLRVTELPATTFIDPPVPPAWEVVLL